VGGFLSQLVAIFCRGFFVPASLFDSIFALIFMIVSGGKSGLNFAFFKAQNPSAFLERGSFQALVLC